MLSSKLANLGKTVFVRFFATEAAKPAATSLYNFHVEKGGKIVNFGGFLLPVQYSDQGIANSHLYTRKNASLFDVSHMLQTEITGPDGVQYLEKLCTADVQGLKEGSAVLTVFTNEKGGILDDLIITKIDSNHLYIVSNAARKEHDQQLLLKALEKYKQTNKSSQLKIRFFDPKERSLLALQGPKAAEVLQKLTDVDLSKLYFMTSVPCSVAGVTACRITRCGYTGEDGFEISVPAFKTGDVANELLNGGVTKLAGLGARDSLRLEAGLCLYGNDITAETTPVEAGLTWLVAKRRREVKDFPGADIIVKQIKEGVSRKRIGLVSSSGPPARHDAAIFNEDGSQQIGIVTSGCPGPSLGKNVAMGYVPTEFSKVGAKLNLKIREKLYEAVVTKMPFVKANYYTKPK
ncbi:hypothetical protein ILUMI_05563 [Ignelater luminosus]|uniref:Aminomethyltransferase n=1 Tax=Ignelater luminosus TaxID=2038154 RepID=A0A8K0D7H0_IGNLU|nr:hypothetical protein ILUMI_05563 [Ignelater luminosus]